VVLAFGGKDPLFIAMGFVIISEDLERGPGQGDHAILGPFAALDVNQHAVGVEVGDLKMDSF
jgi:hypothetical protein